MKDTTKITDLIVEELKRAREKFPQPTNSPHEGYAVLLEEIDEMVDEVDLIRILTDVLWKNVKTDNLQGQKETLTEMKEHVVLLIKEAVQVGAMIEKYEQDILKP